MKKLFIIFIVIVLTGCTNKYNEINFDTIENNIIGVISSIKARSNTVGNGFKYYKPRDFAILEKHDFNHVLVHESTKYYLNIDINAYNSKYKSDYIVNPSIYYSDTFEFNNINGFIDIREGNNSYFYLKMMYNYSCVEVSVPKYRLNDAIIDSIIILSSIEYNDKVIDSFINNQDVDSKENTFNIKQPKVINKERKNILDVYDKDIYNEE